MEAQLLIDNKTQSSRPNASCSTNPLPTSSLPAPGMKIYDEETFGPVTTVVRVKGVDQTVSSPTTPPVACRLECSAVT
jgi:hypothetical protein